MTQEKIPTIFASIGHHGDVNTRPTSRDAVAAVLSVSGERERLDRIEHPELYIAQLEQAVREALSPQFLADSLREWAYNSAPRDKFVNGGMVVFVAEDIADVIASKSL